jgi:formylglycine-generating enzyme required for sulfatase activity
MLGGSWDYNAFSARCASRGDSEPDYSGNDIGFRPSRSSVP